MKSLKFINVSTRIFQYLKIFNSAFLLSALFLASCNNNTLKTGYININKVNKKYTLALEFEKRLESIKKSKKEEYNKLVETYKIAYDSISKIKEVKIEPSQELLSYYTKCKKKHELFKKESVLNLQDSIIFYKDLLNTRINSLVFEYAKKEGYHYVFSPAGSSTFMYGDSSLNITNQVIDYLNEEEEKK